MGKLQSLLEKYTVFLLLILTIPVVESLFVPGFYGASDEVHIAWLYEMDRTLKTGQIPPRFVPDLSYGFGYPLFNFVFPLPFYLGEIFHTLGFSFVDSIKAVFLITMPLSAIFMYSLLRELTNKTLSFLGAILYIFAPYRAVDLYVRGAIGEIVVFVFFPLVALSVVKLTKQAGLKWVGIGGLSTTGLILSHNIATYMFMPFIVLLAFFLIMVNKNKFKTLKDLLAVILLGLLGSIYFWLPALLDSGLMKYDTVFNFVDHFPTIKQLFTPYWGYGASVPGPGDGMSFFLGVSSILLLIIGVMLAIFYWKKYSTVHKVILVWILLSLGIVMFMMNFRSSLVWENAPLLPYFQFPWRFLMMATFLIPLLVITLEKIKYNPVLAIILIVLTLGINSFYFRPQDFLGRTDEYFLRKYIPYDENLESHSEYQLNQEEYLRLPRYTDIRPNSAIHALFNDEGLLPGNTERINALDLSVETFEEKEMTLKYYKYNFPGWKAEIDGKSAEIITGPVWGHITVKIPAGHHKTKIHFTETNFKLALDLISMLALILLIFLILNPKYKNKNV
jgi:hypothetical protein